MHGGFCRKAWHVRQCIFAFVWRPSFSPFHLVPTCISRDTQCFTMSDLFSDTNNSPRSSIYWGSGSESASPRPSSPAVFFNLPDAEPATNPPRPQSPTPSPSRNPNTAVVRQHSSSSQLHSSTQDVNRALENLNRAVQTANEAFQATAPLVDLTYSPPPQYAPRSRRSPRRLSNSSINSAGSLFSSPEPPRLAAMPPLLRSRTSAGTFTQKPRSTADEPAPKRQRISYSRRESRDDGPSQQRQASLHEIEAVDLTEVNDASDIAKALAKQRQDAIQAQTAATQGSDSVGRTAFSSYKCPVCMDTPEDATATICGMLRACYFCLFFALY